MPLFGKKKDEKKEQSKGAPPAYPTQGTYPTQAYPQQGQMQPQLQAQQTQYYYNQPGAAAAPQYQGAPPPYSPSGHNPQQQSVALSQIAHYPQQPTSSNHRQYLQAKQVPHQYGQQPHMHMQQPPMPYMQAPQQNFGPNQTVMVQGGFDAGARFDGVASPNVPPPPPGVAPNAAQMASLQGANVVMTQQPQDFLTGGSGGGYVLF